MFLRLIPIVGIALSVSMFAMEQESFERFNWSGLPHDIKWHIAQLATPSPSEYLSPNSKSLKISAHQHSHILSPDGKWIVETKRIRNEDCICSLKVIIRRFEESVVYKELSIENENCFGVSWHPTEFKLAFVTQSWAVHANEMFYEGGHIYIWDINTNTHIKKKHNDPCDMSWSPDGSQLAIADQNNGIHLINNTLDFATTIQQPQNDLGKDLHSSMPHHKGGNWRKGMAAGLGRLNYLNQVKWNFQGTKLAFWSEKSPLIIWDLETQNICYKLEINTEIDGTPIQHKNHPNGSFYSIEDPVIAWHPDGQHIGVIQKDSKLSINNIITNKNRMLSFGSSKLAMFGRRVLLPLQINFSPDGQLIVISLQDQANPNKSIKLIDFKTLQEQQTYLPHTPTFNPEFQNEGTELTCQLKTFSKNKFIKVKIAKEGALPSSLLLHANAFTPLARHKKNGSKSCDALVDPLKLLLTMQKLAEYTGFNRSKLFSEAQQQEQLKQMGFLPGEIDEAISNNKDLLLGQEEYDYYLFLKEKFGGKYNSLKVGIKGEDICLDELIADNLGPAITKNKTTNSDCIVM